MYTLAMVLRPLIERKLPINAAFSESLIPVEIFYDHTPVETGSYSVVSFDVIHTDQPILIKSSMDSQSNISGNNFIPFTAAYHSNNTASLRREALQVMFKTVLDESPRNCK